MDMTVTPLVERSNEYYLDAFRGTMGADYQAHVPEATQGNIEESIKGLYNYQGGLNQFTNSLVNRVGRTEVRNNAWSNPLAKFKDGLLEYGDTVEESQIGLIDAYVYDHDRSSGSEELFGRVAPNVKTIFHTINREDKYKFTVDLKNLKRAFLEPMGIHKFIKGLMETANTSAARDEFLIMANLFSQFHKNDGFFTVHIDDVGAEGSTAAQARFALRRITEIAETLPFLSKDYNPAHMDVSADPTDLEMFCTPEFKAAIDIEALAAVFNTDKASLPPKLTVIPSKFFAITGVQAILTTRDFFRIYDVLLETTSLNNAAGLYENFWLHVHQIVSVSTFVPAVMFWTGPSSVIEADATPVTDILPLVIEDRDGDIVTDVIRGSIYQITGSAVTAPAGGVNDGVRIALVGAKSPRTFLSPTNALFVAYDETATQLVLTATALDDNAITETLTVAVSGTVYDAWTSTATEDVVVVP